MKCLLVLAFCIVAVVANPKPSKRRCDDYHDCEETECCVTHPESIFFKKGFCQSLAALGETCNHIDYIILDRYKTHCPCQKGLECIPERTEIVPYVGEVRHNERCQVPAETTVAPQE